MQILHSPINPSLTQDALSIIKAYIVHCSNQVAVSKTGDNLADEDDSLQEYFEEQNFLYRTLIASYMFENLYETFHKFLSNLIGSNNLPAVQTVSMAVDIWVSMSKFLVEVGKLVCLFKDAVLY
jgi:hypothetical protein